MNATCLVKCPCENGMMKQHQCSRHAAGGIAYDFNDERGRGTPPPPPPPPPPTLFALCLFHT
ncbi:hypothetical protein SLEP1_g27306 [Rubroshorea leprosula]|uniref:Uncharacterized protein n=1 Tax=Rubroshorea leprosula TaxID=152421 RepID=A0AAV5JPU5_9ROSI|nr:hypothetical protein SLEP1_g27306 [Rubroshorea leprosula]